MKIFLPVHMDALNNFIHTWSGMTFLLLMAIGLYILSIILLSVADYFNSIFVGIASIVSVALALTALCLAASCQRTTSSYNPRKNTVYAMPPKDVEANAHWKESPYVGRVNFNNQYWHDEYLQIDHSDVKIAKTHWSNEGQTVSSLNSTGKAWLKVAQKVQMQPQPHADTKFDIHLSYTKASVETPDGVKKFVCYVNNQKTHSENNYQVIDYK